MRISDKIYLVASGPLGLRLTNSFDCNVYLLDGGDEAALIDAGGGVEAERIVREIERDGVPLAKLKSVLLTHAHGDHAAGAHFWREKFGLKVLCPRAAQEWIETGDEQKISLDVAREAGIYPPDFIFPPCPIDGALGDGNVVSVGDIALEVLETPGHARGHVSYYWRAANALFSGDVVFPGGKISPQMTWDFSMLELKSSIAKVHDLRIEQLFAGHGAPLLTSAHQDVAIAHAACEKLRFPKSLV